MLALFAEWERETFRERARSGRLERARKGHVHARGFALYGYRYDPETKKHVLNEDEAVWVRRIFEWYNSGITTSEIVRRLREAGAPTTEEMWSRQKVSTIVTREEYTGVGWSNRYYPPAEAKKRGTKFRPESEWIEIEDAYPAIIDHKTFTLAQAVRGTHKNFADHPKTGAQYLLAGLLHCKECGKKFATNTTTVKAGKGIYRYYRCSGLENYDYPHERTASYKAEEVEGAVWEVVRWALHDPVEMVRRMGMVAEEALGEGTGEDEARELIREADGHLAKIATRRRKVQAAYEEDDTYTVEELKARLSEIENDRRRWEDQKARAEGMISGAANVQALVERIVAMQVDIMRADEWTIERRREKVREVVGKVEMHSDGTFTVDLLVPEPKAQATTVEEAARFWPLAISS